MAIAEVAGLHVLMFPKILTRYIGLAAYPDPPTGTTTDLRPHRITSLAAHESALVG
jgi:hypothetical protein